MKLNYIIAFIFFFIIITYSDELEIGEISSVQIEYNLDQGEKGSLMLKNKEKKFSDSTFHEKKVSAYSIGFDGNILFWEDFTKRIIFDPKNVFGSCMCECPSIKIKIKSRKHGEFNFKIYCASLTVSHNDKDYFCKLNTKDKQLLLNHIEAIGLKVFGDLYKKYIIWPDEDDS